MSIFGWVWGIFFYCFNYNRTKIKDFFTLHFKITCLNLYFVKRFALVPVIQCGAVQPGDIQTFTWNSALDFIRPRRERHQYLSPSWHQWMWHQRMWHQCMWNLVKHKSAHKKSARVTSACVKSKSVLAGIGSCEICFNRHELVWHRPKVMCPVVWCWKEELGL